MTSVESKEVAGQTLTFVTMKREEDGAVVMVPEAKVRSIGLRKVAGRADVERVFAFLRSDSDKANLDEGNMWPTSFALKDLAPADEARIAALVKKAAG